MRWHDFYMAPSPGTSVGVDVLLLQCFGELGLSTPAANDWQGPSNFTSNRAQLCWLCFEVVQRFWKFRVQEKAPHAMATAEARRVFLRESVRLGQGTVERLTRRPKAAATSKLGFSFLRQASIGPRPPGREPPACQGCGDQGRSPISAGEFLCVCCAPCFFVLFLPRAPGLEGPARLSHEPGEAERLPLLAPARFVRVRVLE